MVGPSFRPEFDDLRSSPVQPLEALDAQAGQGAGGVGGALPVDPEPQGLASVGGPDLGEACGRRVACIVGGVVGEGHP